MPTFKPGDTIKMLEDCTIYEEGEILTVKIEPSGELYVGDGITYCICQTHWQLTSEPKTLYNLEIGDEVQCEDEKRKILSVLPSDPKNPIYVLSWDDNYEMVSDVWSAKLLKEEGFVLILAQKDPLPVTQAEVNEKFGRQVKIVD